VSCGNPHETDCSEVLSQVYLFLDDECDADCRARLAKHLTECAPCHAAYGAEERLKSLLVRCCRESAPEHLRDRLHQQLRQSVLEQSQVTVQRGPQGTSVEVRTTRIERRQR
jgi:mycothiol system anti-sigma-R factor